MNYKLFGRTGMYASELVLGTGMLGDRSGYGSSAEEESIYKLDEFTTDFDLDLSTQHNGIYLLKVSKDGIIKTSKIIKLDPR